MPSAIDRVGQVFRVGGLAARALGEATGDRDLVQGGDALSHLGDNTPAMRDTLKEALPAGASALGQIIGERVFGALDTSPPDTPASVVSPSTSTRDKRTIFGR